MSEKSIIIEPEVIADAISKDDNSIVKSFTTETEITAVAISNDNFIANASYNNSDNTVSLWYSINSNTFDSIKINLNGKVPFNDKVDLTISKLIPSLNSRFVILSYLSKKKDSSEEKAVLIVLQLENELNKTEPEDMTENDSDEAIPKDATIKLENDTDEIKSIVVTINSENEIKCNREIVLEEAETVFIFFKNGKQSQTDILKEVIGKTKAGFISAEFLADSEILAIKYKTAIQFVSVKFEPWILFNELDLCNQDEATLIFNPSKHESYVLLPWRGKKIIDMVNIKCDELEISIKRNDLMRGSKLETSTSEKRNEQNTISCISKSIVDKKAVISSTGDLLVFENGPIVERQTGLHITNIAEHMLSNTMKDFLFVNDDQHLLIVYPDKTSLVATLIDVYSGTKLKSVITPPEPELANLKHIQLINNYVVTVTSSKNNTVIKKWVWKKFFCDQPRKMKLEEWQSEEWRVKGILLPSNFNFNNFDFDNLCDINTEDDANCFFLFWKNRKNNDKTRCLVWMRDEIEKLKNPGYKPAIKINNFEVDEDGTLQLYYKHKDKEFYTFLPLSSAIEGKNLSAEWMQSSCNYLNYLNYLRKQEEILLKEDREIESYHRIIQKVILLIKNRKTKKDKEREAKIESINSLKDIITNSIRQYANNNVFNGTTAICNFIDSDASDVEKIIEEILSYKNYMPTGLHKKNPLTKVIEKRNISLTGKILEYCLCHYFRNYEPGFMSIVVDALPSLAIEYPKMLRVLLEQCTYLKVPPEWEIDFQETVVSTKNLNSHGLDRFTEQQASLIVTKNAYTDLYSATYCHVPLYNLCHSRSGNFKELLEQLLPYDPSPKFTFHNVPPYNLSHLHSGNFIEWLKQLFSYRPYDNLSPFSKLTFLQSSEVFQSPLFEAIVMHRKEDAYLAIYGYLFYYILYFCLFVAATITTKSNPTSSRKLMIASISFGAIWATCIWSFQFVANLFLIRIVKHKVKKIFTTLIEIGALFLPFITGCLELNNKTAPPELRSLSILFLWIFIFLQFRIFRSVGVFIAVFTNIFRQIWPILIFLAFILFAFAHSLMVLLSESTPDGGDKKDNKFTGFYQSLKSTWLILLNDYSSLEPWKNNYLVDIFMIAFSLSTAIVMFNILIALVSTTYEKTFENAHTIWVMEMAEIIAEFELNPFISSFLLSERDNPWTVIYEASTENVNTKHEEVKRKYKEDEYPWTLINEASIESVDGQTTEDKTNDKEMVKK